MRFKVPCRESGDASDFYMRSQVSTSRTSQDNFGHVLKLSSYHTTMKVSAALLLAVAVTGSAASVPDYEKDFDFFGNDLGSWVLNPVLATPEANLDQCFSLCTGAWAPNCKAVTFFQGTCYFKSTHGEGSRLVGAISSGVYDNLGVAKNGYCPNKVEENIDYVDNDIGSRGGSSDQCCQWCREFDGCRAYTWSGHQGGTCWFKSKRGATTAKDGVISALAYPPSVDHVLAYDLDYVDHDIGNRPSATAEGCFGICNLFPGCFAFTWSDFARGTCWLKASKGDTVYKRGVVSAVVKPNAPVCAPTAFHDNTDISDHDLANKNAITNVNDCPNFCKVTPGCKGFVWSDFMGGTCWLKSHTPPETGVTAFPKTGVKACFAVV